jgi:hypothetical protein
MNRPFHASKPHAENKLTGRCRVHSPQQTVFMLTCFNTIAPRPRNTKRCNLSHMCTPLVRWTASKIAPRFIHIPPHGRLITARRCSETTRKQLTALSELSLLLVYFFSPRYSKQRHAESSETIKGDAQLFTQHASPY